LPSTPLWAQQSAPGVEDVLSLPVPLHPLNEAGGEHGAGTTVIGGGHEGGKQMLFESAPFPEQQSHPGEGDLL